MVPGRGCVGSPAPPPQEELGGGEAVPLGLLMSSVSSPVVCTGALAQALALASGGLSFRTLQPVKPALGLEIKTAVFLCLCEESELSGRRIVFSPVKWGSSHVFLTGFYDS